MGGEKLLEKYEAILIISWSLISWSLFHDL